MGSASSAGTSPCMRHIQVVTSLPNRARLLGVSIVAGLAIAPVGIAMAAPGGAPGAAQGNEGNAAARPGNGNGGGNPVTTPPGRPTTPGPPALPGAGTGGGGNSGGGNGGVGNGGGGNGAGAAPGAVPKGVPTAGLAVGRGTVQVRAYVDLGDIGNARAHQRVIPALLDQVAAEGLGSVVLRPLVMGRDANSVEAAGALIAAARQDRAWFVAGYLVTARIEGVGDWITPSTLRSIGRSVGGLAVARFVRDATSRSVYPQLNAIRREARAAKVTVTPAFVVKGPRGTRVVRNPAQASGVLSAIGEVR